MDKVLVHRGLTTLDVLVIGLLVVVVFESAAEWPAQLRLQPHHQPHRRRTRRAPVPPPGATAAGLLPGAARRRFGGPRARAGEHPQLPDRQRADGAAGRRLLHRLRRRHAVLQRAAHADRAGEHAAVLRPEPGSGAHPAQRLDEKVRPRRREPGHAGGDRQRHPDRQGQRAGTGLWAPLGQPARRLCLGQLPNPEPCQLGARRRQPHRQARQRRHPLVRRAPGDEQRADRGPVRRLQHVRPARGQPIMRMAQLWTDFQQTGISMARLGDILNTRTEVPPSSAAQLPRSRAA
jgi:hypothetical protein